MSNNVSEQIKALQAKRNRLIQNRREMFGPGSRRKFSFNRLRDVSDIDEMIKGVDRELMKLGVKYD